VRILGVGVVVLINGLLWRGMPSGALRGRVGLLSELRPVQRELRRVNRKLLPLQRREGPRAYALGISLFSEGGCGLSTLRRTSERSRGLTCVFRKSGEWTRASGCGL
jgi:hypothetical protein